ncbi:hypothetical protein HG536_0F01060 [Torulaspora globosa]|uniref:Phospholipase C/D domain-containing protein n=1 Tax=Torulaspora globosa TaxID=48254 RepID=A0A7G3ZJU5_9SACH|nr:uncharacterized protein HG536_0F01060 [Torulaspora globosa]QLL33781.1 hypothetical protein HG536_0F01060 [Torulaspora globosa]
MLCNAIRFWILLSLLMLCVFGAGVATHLTYLARVIPDKFHDYGPWLKAGAFFPDTLYSCKPSENLADFAERAHWPQFLISALELWQDRYGSNSSKRDSRDSLRFQAFLIGIFSHQIVDSSWHSLVDGYRSHGLLRVLAETEFGGDVDEAHNYLDVMGDFIVMSNVFKGIADPGWQYYTDTNWSLPREKDVMELLHRNGVNHDEISYKELNVCLMRGLSASLSEVYVTLNRRVEILNVAYGISPASRELIQDCWLGGEFDLIALLHACLPVFQNLFEPHTELELQARRLQLCGNLPEVSRPLSGPDTNLDFRYDGEVVIVSSRVPQSNFGTSIAVGRFEEDKKLYAAVSAPLEQSKGSIYLIALEDPAKANTAVMKPFTSMRGLAVHTYRFNDKDFLIVSEPGSNCIYFYRARRRILTIYDRTADAFQLQLSCVTNINGDSVPDLILSGSSYGRNETGCAMLVPGSSLISYLNSDHPTEVEISALTAVRLNGEPFKKPYQHFGAALTSSYSHSPSGFLYVTCQGLGMVLVYSLSGLHSNSLPRYVIMAKEITLFKKYNYDNAEILPSSRHGMFGKIMLSWNYVGESFVAISQHLFNSVFIYHEIDGKVEFFLKLVLHHDSSTSSCTIGFGTAIQYDDQLKSLYVSSPGSFDGKGAIWRVGMQEIINAVKIWRQDIFYVKAVSHLYFANPQIDSKGVSNFGKAMQIVPDRRIIIGVPQLNYGNLQAEQLTGAIIIK